MKQMKHLRMWLAWACLMWALFAATFLFMKPVVESQSASGRTATVLLGLAFWALLALAVLFTATAAGKYRAICRQKKITVSGLPGLLRFFRNPFAVVVDCLLLLAAIFGIGLLILRPENQYFYFADLFLLAMTVPLHAIANGKMVRISRYSRYSGGKKRCVNQ